MKLLALYCFFSNKSNVRIKGFVLSFNLGGASSIPKFVLTLLSSIVFHENRGKIILLSPVSYKPGGSWKVCKSQSSFSLNSFYSSSLYVELFSGTISSRLIYFPVLIKHIDLLLIFVMIFQIITMFFASFITSFIRNSRSYKIQGAERFFKFFTFVGSDH